MKGRDKKLPAMQWYPGDWRKDIAVQSLGYFERGVWREMLDIMHDSERRGVMVLNGVAMSSEQMARTLGLDIQIFNQTLSTLLSSGVASLEPETGAVMNRRMVRDEHIRKVRQMAGKNGGNPALLKQKQTTQDNQTPNQKEGSSSSSSTSVLNTPPSRAREMPPSPGADGEFMAATGFLQDMEIPASNGDIRIMAQLIQFEAKHHGGVEGAVAFLAERVTEARNRGEPVTVFWLKDKKYQQEANADGTNSGNRGGSAGRVERSLSAWDRAAAKQRRALALDGDVPSDAGVLPASGVR